MNKARQPITATKRARIAIADQNGALTEAYASPAREVLNITAFDSDAQRRILRETGVNLKIDQADWPTWWNKVFVICRDLGLRSFKPYQQPTKKQFVCALAASERLIAALKPLLDGQDVGLGNVDQATFEQTIIFRDWIKGRIGAGLGPAHRPPNYDAAIFISKMAELFSEGFIRAASLSRGSHLFSFIQACLGECGVSGSHVTGDALDSIIKAERKRAAALA